MPTTWSVRTVNKQSAVLCAQDVTLLEMVWGIRSEWETLYASWKEELFHHVKMDDLQQNTERLLASILSLETQIKQWPIWSVCRVRPMVI